jgi:flagellar biosynthesis chaperone FliJ
MLSTKELKNNISIKKLKAKDAENEKTVKELNKKLDQTTQENVEFKEQVSKMKDLERRHTGWSFSYREITIGPSHSFLETIKNLSSLNEEHSRQFKKMESEFKETKSKLEELQVNRTNFAVHTLKAKGT